MFEKVNPSHPDKIADRIAGALVDRAYAIKDDPKIAVEVLIGHNQCTIISEANVRFTDDEVKNIIKRISIKKELILCENICIFKIYFFSYTSFVFYCIDKLFFV